MKIEKKLWLTLLAFMIFAAGFSGWIFHQKSSGKRISFQNTGQLQTEELVDDGIKTETMRLPEEFELPKSVMFKTTHTVTEVWLDGEKIYEYGKEKNAPGFLKSPGTYWHLVDLPRDSAGKTLEIRIIPVYPEYYGNSVILFYGTRGDCILRLIEDSFAVVLISCGILFAGIISLILYFAGLKRKTEQETSVFLNLGIFSMLIALWALRQCGFLQFLLPDGRTLYFVDFFTFYLFPVPFNFLVYDICKSKYKKNLLYIAGLYLINMAGAVFLQCTGITDIFRILPVTHIIMLVNIIYIVGLINYEVKNLENTVAANFRYPLYIVLSFGLVEMVFYYIRKFQTTSIFLPLGTMIFIIMLIWIQISQYYDQYIRKQKLLYLQKMANMDMLTEAMNRNAYEDMIKYLDEQEIELHTTGVVLFDLDNLKVINDNFGHEKGDEALKLCYKCILRAFKNEKNCFRIGGDEFAYVYHSGEKDLIQGKLKLLEKLLEETGENLAYSLSVSAGYAYYSQDTDIDFKDIVRRSDTMLYRQKRKKKLARVKETESFGSYLEKRPAEQFMDEVIFQEKKYQDITAESICGMIDLFSSSMNNYLYLIDYRTDFYYIAASALERFCIPKNAFHKVMAYHKEFVYGPDYPLLKAEFEDLLGSQRCIHNMEYRWLDVNKKPVWINCRGYLIRDDDMNPLFMIGCINEIGRKQKADNVSGLLGGSQFERIPGNSRGSGKERISSPSWN